jgi:hypothetical protein
MTAWRLYWDLRARGIRLRVLRTRIQAAGALSPVDRQAIRERRDELMDLLERLEERAAIMEYDGGLSRNEAERRAESDLQRVEAGNSDGEGTNGTR